MKSVKVTMFEFSGRVDLANEHSWDKRVESIRRHLEQTLLGVC